MVLFQIQVWDHLPLFLKMLQLTYTVWHPYSLVDSRFKYNRWENINETVPWTYEKLLYVIDRNCIIEIFHYNYVCTGRHWLGKKKTPEAQTYQEDTKDLQVAKEWASKLHGYMPEGFTIDLRELEESLTEFSCFPFFTHGQGSDWSDSLRDLGYPPASCCKLVYTVFCPPPIDSNW